MSQENQERWIRPLVNAGKTTRFTIPTLLTRRLGLKVGDLLVCQEQEGSIVLTPLRRMIGAALPLPPDRDRQKQPKQRERWDRWRKEKALRESQQRLDNEP